MKTGNYYGARYYDPRLSIFLSVDPLAEKTMTAYAYCNNNPINFVDPTGMEGEGWGLSKDGSYTYVEGMQEGDIIYKEKGFIGFKEDNSILYNASFGKGGEKGNIFLGKGVSRFATADDYDMIGLSTMNENNGYQMDILSNSLNGYLGASIKSWEKGWAQPLSKSSIFAGGSNTNSVFNSRALYKSSKLGKIGGVGVGVLLHTPDIYFGYKESNREGNKQVSGAVGGILGGIAGGAGLGVLLGAETGPGAIATGVIGGIIGGFVGEEGVERAYDYLIE